MSTLPLTLPASPVAPPAKKKPRVEVEDGFELIGLVGKAYPTGEQAAILYAIEDRLRHWWNKWISTYETDLDAKLMWAVVREGLVPDPGYRNKRGLPAIPLCDYDGMTSEQSEAAKKRRSELQKAWFQAVREATSQLPRVPGLKEQTQHFGHRWTYQWCKRWEKEAKALGDPNIVEIGAGLWQALEKNYWASLAAAAKGISSRPKHRKRTDAMPLQTGTGECFVLGDFGTRRDVPFYDSCVSINGLKIRARMPRKLRPSLQEALDAGYAKSGPRVLQGVSLVRKADGWWWSIRLHVRKRVLPVPIPGKVIGIDVGLDELVAYSEPVLAHRNGGLIPVQFIHNPRDGLFARDIAEKQRLDKRTGRMHAQASRRVTHLIYSDVVAPCGDFEWIVVEKINSKIGETSSQVKAMRKVLGMLIQRYGKAEEGGRVIEVNPNYTSQVCNACRHHDKHAWAHDTGVGKRRTCPACGHKEHRDVNASRNIRDCGVQWLHERGLASAEVLACYPAALEPLISKAKGAKNPLKKVAA